MAEKSFRARIIEMFEAAFGPAQTVPTIDGPLYRWVLRTPTGNILRLTIDSPEFPHLAHVIISDPRAADGPLTSRVMRTITSAAECIDEIRNRLDEPG